MKIRIFAVSLLFVAFALLLGTSTQAQVVKGEIKVAGAQFTGNPIPPTWKCDYIVVQAISREQVGSGGSGVSLKSPKWQRQAKATGSWSSGSCSYSVKVEANSFFHVQLQTAIGCNVTSTPKEATGIKVAAGATKSQNFKVDAMDCYPPPK